MLKKFILLIVYLIIFYSSLWLTISVRHFDLRGWEFYKSHLLSFTIVFFIWIFILYANRLFDLHIIRNKRKLINFSIKSFILNFLSGSTFFYLFPIMFEKINITPKTNLFLTSFISGIFIFIFLYLLGKLNKVNIKDERLLTKINKKGKNLYEIEKSIKKIKKNTAYYIIKNIIDKIIASFAFLILIILFIPIAIAIKLNDKKGDIFFKQKRVGKNDKIFDLLKFRSMKAGSKKDALWTKKNDNRITYVGKILRKTHLDELPQCVNILRGEMSIVGPRADYIKLVEIMKKKQPLYYLRHKVKPGITGWAQLHYLYGDSIENNLEKLKYDLWYVKNRSVFLDLIIIIKTISVILDHTGR